jgi:hypothetical protein
MAHGSYQLNIAVVPDSGTGQLEDLTRSMTIIIKEGTHTYDLAYDLPASK